MALDSTPQKIRTKLNKLKKTGDIEINPTNKFTIIIIKNYDKWQNINKQITNKKGEISQTDSEYDTSINDISNKQQTNNKQITM